MIPAEAVEAAANAHDQIMYILDDHATTRGEK